MVFPNPCRQKRAPLFSFLVIRCGSSGWSQIWGSKSPSGACPQLVISPFPSLLLPPQLSRSLPLVPHRRICFPVPFCQPPYCNAAAYALKPLDLASHRRPGALPPSSSLPQHSSNTIPGSTSIHLPPPPGYSPPPSRTSPKPLPHPISQPPVTLSSPPNLHPANPDAKTSVLHPRVAVLLGVAKHWHFPLLFCRALSTAPATWWGLRCTLTFMGELLLDEGKSCGVEGIGQPWSVERRFRVTEVFLAVLWCLCAGYLSFYFTDCLMSRWLLNYTPQATLVRLLTINSVNAYITSWVLYLSGGSEDPRLLLPAWISIASTLTFLYHLTHPRLSILKETSLSISVFSIASFISMVSLLLQLHLTRANDPPVPLFIFVKWGLEKALIGVEWFGQAARVGREEGREL